MTGIIEWLDDSDLDPYEFRVLLRISRQFQKGIVNESTESIAAACLMSREKCRQCIESLVQRGLLIQEEVITPEEIKELLSRKTPQKVDGAIHVCEWCNATTFALQQHHYPISKAKDGTQVVSICANCHYEFHHLEQAKRVKPSFVFPWKEVKSEL